MARSTVPQSSVSRELLAYPRDMLSSPPDVTEMTLEFRPGRATSSSPSPAAGPTVTGAPVAGGGAFADLVSWRLSPFILALSLLVAFAFGAVHALGPGHGKTITAAFLVGTGARLRHAVAVGVAVALMHTASVLALGFIVFVLARSFPADQIYPWLTLATGAVALGLGAALFTGRLRARRRGPEASHGHVHPWDPVVPSWAHDAHEHHGVGEPHRAGQGRGSSEWPVDEAEEDGRRAVMVLDRPMLEDPGDDETNPATTHAHPHADSHDPTRAISGRGLLALAVAGGILPSPTAFVVLTGSIGAHRVAYGLGLIVAFSLGLAAALIGVGLLALRARAVVARRLHGPWIGLLPLASALVIVAFGAFFAVRGLAQLG